jgi:hypothetical protein
MSFQQTFVTFGIVAVSAALGSPKLKAQTSALAHEVTRSEIVLANARRVVGEDRTQIDRLEELIDRQRAVIVAGGGWAPPGPDYWDRVFTFQGPRTVLASLEVKRERAKRKLARDQALIDSLQTSRLSAR